MWNSTTGIGNKGWRKTSHLPLKQWGWKGFRTQQENHLCIIIACWRLQMGSCCAPVTPRRRAGILPKELATRWNEIIQDILCHRVLKVSEDPLIVRLKFEPSGRPEGKAGEYYLTVKPNICVVCGVGEAYLRYQTHVSLQCFVTSWPGKTWCHMSTENTFLPLWRIINLTTCFWCEWKAYFWNRN